MLIYYRYQALLQKNLMYLAAIADAQPPTPTPTPNISSQVLSIPYASIYNSLVLCLTCIEL